jgi:hypothetical protein
VEDLIYLDHSDKLLAVSGEQLKLIHRQKGHFDIKNDSQFRPLPSIPSSEVDLELSRVDLKFLMKHLDWT